jgi:hypothetical protein
LALRDRERPGPPRGERQARRGHNSGHSKVSAAKTRGVR